MNPSFAFIVIDVGVWWISFSIYLYSDLNSFLTVFLLQFPDFFFSPFPQFHVVIQHPVISPNDGLQLPVINSCDEVKEPTKQAAASRVIVAASITAPTTRLLSVQKNLTES